jgi:hypothetical protein
MRKHKRYDLNLPVSVMETGGRGGNLVFLLRTENVSAGGALFRADRGPASGTEVRLVFFLQTDPLEAVVDPRHSFHGRVVRSEPGRFAVAFVHRLQASVPEPAPGPDAGAPAVPCGVSSRPDGERG